MYDKSVRRRRAILALLVGVSLILTTAYFGESIGGPLRTVQRGMLEVLSPIQEGANRVLKPVRDLVNWIDDTVKAKGERDRLQSQRDALLRGVVGAEAARRENLQLKEMVGFDRKASLAGYRPVTARVIGRSPTVWYATININAGRSSGVRIDQPVVAGAGLIGKVTTVTADAAQVTLITDHTAAVSAEVNASGVIGLVQPSVGDPNDMLLNFISRKTPVYRGQRVVTAGSRSDRLESLYPPGIPVGWVSKVDSGEVSLYQRVHLKLYADLRRLDFVQVLIKHGGTGG